MIGTGLVRQLAGAVAAVAALMGMASSAQAMDIKFTLDWKFQGPTSFILVAVEKGYYKAEGLDVTVDAGQGSAGAVNRVATGAYELGFADINSLVEYNTANPDKRIKSVMMVYDHAPFGVHTLKSTGITKPADLVGKKLGAPVFDASYKLFPAFAAANGIDSNSVVRVNMDPSLREAMMVRGEVDFISGHYFSSFLDLKARGAKAEDIVSMLYSDYGLDFYGNAIIASPAMIKDHPEELKKFLVATAKGMIDVLKDPAAGVEVTAKTDPLIDKALELERLQLAIDTNIVTPYTKANGFGDVDMARLDRSIDQLALAYGLKEKIPASEVFTAEFLPPAADRMLP
jgi:NitT/TauT family transport system substrate-binding protein